MATVLSVLTRSLRLIGAVDAMESLSAEDSVTALTALNAMCLRWEANGLALGWTAQTLSGTMPSPDEAEEAIVYNLAVRLAPEYGVPEAFGIITDMARTFLAELRRDRLTEMPLRQASDLPTAVRQGYWDIYTDDGA